MKLTALAISVWDADDFLNDRNTNPRNTTRYLFATEEEAREYAKDNTDADIDNYNDATMLADIDVDEATILEESGCESIEDFMECLNEPYSTTIWHKAYGHDEKERVADYIFENCSGQECDVECSNYDFDKRLDGAILVEWTWHRYTGYARKVLELRYAYYNETESVLTKQDSVTARQVDVVLTAEKVAASSDLALDLTNALLDGSWKWTDKYKVEQLIEDLTHVSD